MLVNESELQSANKIGELILAAVSEHSHGATSGDTRIEPEGSVDGMECPGRIGSEFRIQSHVVEQLGECDCIGGVD